MPSFLKANNISAPHGFFGRKGGVSKGEFFSLNCGHNKGDSSESVEQNRKLVLKALGLQNHKLFLNIQRHTNIIRVVKDSDDFAPIEGDALITQTPGITLGIFTADCGPVLLHEEKSNMVAAIHAGWRGALSGIVEVVIQKMIDLGADATNIRAAVGPCLGLDNFAIGADFFEFTKTHQLGPDFIVNQNRFDLRGFLNAVLRGCGVESIENQNICTYAHADAYFSYRRATHQNAPQFGVQISTIGL